MPTEEETWLKFHDGQYQFKVPLMLYADFESILKPVDERYRNKMNIMKAGRKGKASYTEKINTHVPSGWCVHSTFAYGGVPNPLKMYRAKDSVEKVCGIHRGRGKATVCNISTESYDRAY